MDGQLFRKASPMSSEAISYVWRHSPFKGATFQVHLAIADSVNDQNHNEFWLSQSRLSTKARVFRTTSNAALQALLDEGCLELLEEGGGRSRPSRYRFLFPDKPVVFESRPAKKTVATDDTSKTVASDTETVATDSQTVASRSQTVATDDRHRTQGNPREPKGTQTIRVEQPDNFEEFWKRYPSRDGKKLEKPKAKAQWKRTPEAQVAAVFVGVDHYREACEEGLTRAKDAHRWLRDRCWEDWQTPASPDQKRDRSPNQRAFDKFRQDLETNPAWEGVFDEEESSYSGPGIPQKRLSEGEMGRRPNDGVRSGNGRSGLPVNSNGNARMGPLPTISPNHRGHTP